MNSTNLLMFLAAETSDGNTVKMILDILLLIIHGLLPLGVCIYVYGMMKYSEVAKYTKVVTQTRKRILICGIIRIVLLALAAMFLRDLYMISLGKLFEGYYTIGGALSTPIHEGVVNVYKFLHSYPALHINVEKGQYIVDALAGLVIVIIQFRLVTRISGLLPVLQGEADRHNATVERTYHDEIEITQIPTYEEDKVRLKTVVNKVEDTKYVSWDAELFLWIIGMFVFPITFIIIQIVLTIREIKRCK